MLIKHFWVLIGKVAEVAQGNVAEISTELKKLRIFHTNMVLPTAKPQGRCGLFHISYFVAINGI